MSKWKGARNCLARMLGAGAASFGALLSSAENIETYLPWTAAVWLTIGPMIACLWAYEVLCVGEEKGENDEE
jgi:hypothetical protein